MAWFKRLRRKLRNSTSDGDYAGSHGGSGSGSDGRNERNAKAQGEAIAHRPDRYGGGDF
ncbi:MAG TPA: hypothetical protein VLN74_00205 [Ilumatobacteraceae bacterium]|nr:hypothetical protein [Ilumatobacteraceae bacterium]